MGVHIQRRQKARPFMATQLYDVQYEDGRERVKQLHDADAEMLRDQRGVKSVKKRRNQPADKRRVLDNNKGRGQSTSGQEGDDE